MHPIQPDQRKVASVNTTAFKPFSMQVHNQTTTPGESYLSLDESYPPGGGFHLYRMAPGTTTVPHEHNCDEQFYVIEGELTDNDGFTYRQGDLVLLKNGTQHSSYSKDGCLLAVFIAAPETTVT